MLITLVKGLGIVPWLVKVSLLTAALAPTSPPAGSQAPTRPSPVFFARERAAMTALVVAGEAIAAWERWSGHEKTPTAVRSCGVANNAKGGAEAPPLGNGSSGARPTS